MKRVLLVGCGYVGSALARMLLDQGAKVWGVRRSVSELPEGVQPLAHDLLEAWQPESLPEELDAVVFSPSVGPGAGEGDYRALYRDGLERLLEALGAKEGHPRLFFASSTGVYGQTDGSWVDEASRAEPGHYSGKVLLEAESVASSWPNSSSLRISGIYGPDRTGLLERLRSGGVGPTKTPLYTNRIHRDDVAGAIAHLLRVDRLEPCYLLSDDEPAELNHVLAWLAERIGTELPEPAEGTRTAGRIWRSNKRCRNKRLVQSGYTLRYPTWREGWESLV